MCSTDTDDDLTVRPLGETAGRHPQVMPVERAAGQAATGG